MKIAIIPARGGSRRIPKKNIKFFCGKPIIGWTIDIVKKSKIFNKIIVSTDDKKIALIAKKYNAEVPFIRPNKLGNDKVGTLDVVAHAVSWLQKKGYKPSEVCCIYPTAPLLQKKDLINSLKDLRSGKWEYIFSATTFGPSIYRSFTKNRKEKLKVVFSKKINKRSQDLEQAYHDAGQFYWATAKTWIEKKKIFGKKSKIALLPRWRVQDIDVMDDWKKAEIIFRLLKKKGNNIKL
tara:strand:- start:621 stop:1328 length:708 start_codon:yes stop_codon:yes gene_type:complete